MVVMDTEPSRMWKGRSPQARVAERRAQLVEAAVELLGTEGVGGLTMRAVCRVAELSPRYFYESFADRDALMLEAFDQTLARMRAVVTAALSGSSTSSELLREAFDAAARLVAEDRRVGRILFREPFADDRLRPHATAAIPTFFITALSGLDERGRLLETGDPRKLDLQISALSGALISLFLDWTEGKFGDDRSTFADYCTHVVLTTPRSPITSARG